jgi:plastocyanin
VQHRRLSLGLVSAATIAVCAMAVSCGDATNDSAAPFVGSSTAVGVVATDPMAVALVDFAFVPEMLTVPVGSSIVWTNNDSVAHSVRTNDGSFAEQAMKPGATATATFAKAGSYAYICGVHPFMTGTVVVQ